MKQIQAVSGTETHLSVTLVSPFREGSESITTRLYEEKKF